MTQASPTRAELDMIVALLGRALTIADEIGDTYLGALIGEAHDLAQLRDDPRP